MFVRIKCVRTFLELFWNTAELTVFFTTKMIPAIIISDISSTLLFTLE